MKKRVRNMYIARAIKMVHSAGGIYINGKAVFRWNRDGCHYPSCAWAVLEHNGQYKVEVELGFAPEGVFIAGEDERRCADRPDSPDGKWEAGKALEAVGILPGRPWSVRVAEMASRWSQGNDQCWKTMAALRREKSQLKCWVENMVAAGATAFEHKEYEVFAWTKANGSRIGSFSSKEMMFPIVEVKNHLKRTCEFYQVNDAGNCIRAM